MVQANRLAGAGARRWQSPLDGRRAQSGARCLPGHPNGARHGRPVQERREGDRVRARRDGEGCRLIVARKDADEEDANRKKPSKE